MKKSCVALLLLLGFVGTASAHHSFAMFDEQKTVALTGTVKVWEWTNPHSWLVLVTQDAQGNNIEWQIEGSSPNNFRRAGVSRDIVKAGDRVTVMIYPLKSGAHGGQFRGITTADGKTIDLAGRLNELGKEAP